MWWLLLGKYSCRCTAAVSEKKNQEKNACAQQRHCCIYMHASEDHSIATSAARCRNSSSRAACQPPTGVGRTTNTYIGARFKAAEIRLSHTTQHVAAFKGIPNRARHKPTYLGGYRSAWELKDEEELQRADHQKEDMHPAPPAKRVPKRIDRHTAGGLHFQQQQKI